MIDPKAKKQELIDEGKALIEEHTKLAEANSANSRRMAEIKARVDFLNGAIEAYQSMESDGQTPVEIDKSN